MMCNILLRVGAITLFVIGVLVQVVLLTNLVDGELYAWFDAGLQVVEGCMAAILKGYSIPVVALLAICPCSIGRIRRQ